VLPPQLPGVPREKPPSPFYIGVRSLYRGPFRTEREAAGRVLYLRPEIAAREHQGVPWGPVSGREVTQNDGVARERKRPAQSPSRAITAGHGTLRTNLAKVGVAGSSPVVRSRECTLQPAAMQAPPIGDLSVDGSTDERPTNVGWGWRREPGRARSASRSELGERDRTEFQGKETRGTLLNARP
jgi:hypothetical protein